MGRLELARRGHRRDDEVVARERATAGRGKERATAVRGKCEFHNIECKERINHG